MIRMFFSNKKEIKKLNSALVQSFQNVKQDIAQINQSSTSTSQQINNITDWINYLNQQNQHLASQNQVMKTRLDRMDLQLSTMGVSFDTFGSQMQDVSSAVKDIKAVLDASPISREEIKQIIDYYYDFEHILSKLSRFDSFMENVNQKLEGLSTVKSFDMHSQLQYLAEIKELKQKIHDIEATQKKPSSREKLIKKITRKSRDYVKNLLLSYIKKYERISALRLRDMIVEEQGLASKSAFYRLLEEIEQLDEIEVIREGKEKFLLHRIMQPY